MAQHTITLTVSGNRVTAVPNPLSGVQPTDTVVFDIQGAPQGTVIDLEFREVRRSSALIGPFVSISPTSPTQITGTAGAGQRFIYKVFAVNQQGQRTELTWNSPLEPLGNFGGIDVPQPPP